MVDVCHLWALTQLDIITGDFFLTLLATLGRVVSLKYTYFKFLSDKFWKVVLGD